MLFDKSFDQKLFQLNDSEFNEVALEVFKFQACSNIIYKRYLSELGINLKTIKRVEHIPFLPISFFKNAVLKSEVWSSEHIFESSGTTGSINAQHHVRSLAFYENHSRKLFEDVYGSVEDYHIMALLPSYLERDSSSLVFMVNNMILHSDSDFSGFYLDNFEQILTDITKAKKAGGTILLLGVSFALLDLIEYADIDLKDHIVMETGGMKGRRKEMIREDLHSHLKAGFNVSEIHSEYGMTELMSQAYSTSDGLYRTSRTMKVMIRDMYDPFDLSKKDRSGGINVIDLANYATCSFIETSDLGMRDGEYFRVLGRFDNSEIRGCNLMLS